MTDKEIRYWTETASMCRKSRDVRVKEWEALKERLKLKFEVEGVKGKKIMISRFYKIVREVIASTAYKNPYVYIKPEADPADQQSGSTLANSSAILEDFANDGLEIMRCAPIVQQVLFDALFCYNGFVSFDLFPAKAQTVAPYLATDAMFKGFPFIRHVKPQYMLTDPLCEAHDFYSSRFVGEEMFVGIDDLIGDPRFKDHKEKLQQLANKDLRVNVSGEGKKEDWMSPESGSPEDKEAMSEAHRLAGTVRCVQWCDRVGRRRIFFVDGIKEPIEEIEHPLLRKDLTQTLDPNPENTRPLLGKVKDKATSALSGIGLVRSDDQVEDQEANPDTGTVKVDMDAEWLVEGGLPYFRLHLDVAEEFWATPIMEYENEYQNAIIRIVTRKVQILDRFKRMAKIKKGEADNNTTIRDRLRSPEDGELLELNDLNSLEPLDWGTIPAGEDSLMRDILSFESESVRTTGSANTQALATGKALAASADELNREYNQGPVNDLFIWVTKNMFKTLSYEPLTPKGFNLRRTSEAGAEMTDLALEAWHLQGQYNFNVAAGSSNILYEKMNRQQSGELAQALATSPNVDRLKMDKYLIRSWGEVDPETFLKDAANINAAKAAALEIELFFEFAAQGYDPGVTPGEDHNTHIKLQNPQVVQKHPKFLSAPPPIQQAVMQAVGKHIAAHQQQMQVEAGGTQKAGAAIAAKGDGGAKDLVGEAQSFAQKAAHTVKEEAETA